MMKKTLSDALLTFAATMSSDYLATDALDALMVQAAEALSVDGGGIMLIDDDGGQRFVAASDERVKEIEQMQVDTGEGPCVMAAETGEIIITDDLREGDERFPEFAEAAVDIGMLSVHSFPMRIEDVTLGAMNLYRDKPGKLDQEEQDSGVVFADMSALYLLTSRRAEKATESIEHLRQALDRNAPIEQAKGYVAGVRHIPPMDAYELLRAHARRNRLRVLDVASKLVDGRLSIADLDDADQDD